MRITKYAVVGAAATMAFATASPALAHESTSTTGPQRTASAPTLAQQKAWLDAYLTTSQQRLTALAARIAADPHLTSQQRSAWAAKIAQQQAALTARSAVDAATTESALHQAVHAAMTADSLHGMFGWRALCDSGYRLDRDEQARDRAATKAKDAQRARDARAKQARDPHQGAVTVADEHPAVATHPASGTHQVVLRSTRQDGAEQARQSRTAWHSDTSGKHSSGAGFAHHGTGHRHH
ncbi:MAG TPA: hypothetical protein VMB79_02245 [Jatrophihabitans sp.]|nr:hypothetical protein [Jatrophihabitans sp.]